MIVVAVVASCFLGPEILALVAGPGGATAGELLVAGALTGAASSAIAQGVGIAIGAQDGFSWQGVALGALSGAMAGGLSRVNFTGATGANALTTTGNVAARAAIANGMTQGVAVATGLQRSFDWRGVAAAGAGAAVGSLIGKELLGQGASGQAQQAQNQWSAIQQIGKASLAGFAAGMTTAAMRGGRISVAQVAADAFGNALGNSIVEANWGGNGQQEEPFSQSSQDAYNPAADPDNIARAQHFAMNSYAAQDVPDPSQPRVISDASSGSNGGSGLAGSDSDWNGSYDVHKFKIFMDRYSEAYPGSSDEEVMTQYDRMRATQSSNSIGDSNGATGEARAIGALEGFFTFDKPGQLLKGVGLSLKAPVDVVIGAGNLVSDAYGFTAGAITGEPYQAQSGLVQSIQSQGLVATAGDLFANTVKSLPGIAQINSLYRNDMVGLGQSLPGLIGGAGGLKVFGGEGFGANGVAALSRGEEFRLKYGHLSANQRSAIIFERTEEIALQQLVAKEAATTGAHFLARHSAGTSLRDQLVSSATGLRPDGKIMGFPNKRFAVDSTKFLSNKDMLYGINRAERIQQYAISTGNPVDDYISFRFREFVGEGFVKNTPMYGADLSQFYRRTQYANFGINSTTGNAVTAFPVLSPNSLGVIY